MRWKHLLPTVIDLSSSHFHDTIHLREKNSCYWYQFISIYFFMPTFFFCAIVVACYFMLSWESRMNKISAFLRGVQGEGENQYERLKYERRWRAFQQHTRVTKNKITYSMHVNNNSLVFFLTISSTWTTIDFRCAPSERNSFGAPVCR
jgi:hypothetical protein